MYEGKLLIESALAVSKSLPGYYKCNAYGECNGKWQAPGKATKADHGVHVSILPGCCDFTDNCVQIHPGRLIFQRLPDFNGTWQIWSCTKVSK